MKDEGSVIAESQFLLDRKRRARFVTDGTLDINYLAKDLQR